MSGCDIKHLIKTTKFLPDIYINGEKLDKTTLAQEIQYHPAESFQAALQQAAQALIIRQLLRREAEAAGLDLSDEETAFATLINANAGANPPSEDDCERYYQQNPATFTSAPLMVVRHILLAADKNDLPARQVQRELAEKLLRDLQKSHDLAADFARAVRFSRCPSRENGGLLGELSAGQTVPEFERQVFCLPAGLAPQPIETRYGYHLVWVEKKIDGKAIPFASARARIFDYLTARRERQAAADYLYRLAGRAKIEGFNLQLTAENIVLN